MRADARSERFLLPVKWRLIRKTRRQTPIPQIADISFATSRGWPTKKLMTAQTN
jgi:hypothetical protein